MATKQQISKCLRDTLEKARVFLGAGVGIDTEGAKTDKSNIDNFLEQARQRASLRLQKGLWDAEQNRRIMLESIGSARESLAQDIANAIQTKAPENSDATQTTSYKPKAKRTRYPKDSEALGILQEAKRRKGIKSYSDCSNADIIKCMITEPQSKWARRILYGKLKRKAGGKMLEYPTPINAEKAAANWGKYLSAYLKDRPLKQRI